MNRSKMQHKKLGIFSIPFGLVSNTRDFVNGDLEKKLQSKFGTNFRVLNPETKTDFHIHIVDEKVPLKISASNGTLFTVGDFTELDKEFGEVHSIIRYAVYNYLLSCLEERGIYNIHASAIYRRKEGLFIFIGPSGAGKTSCMLAGVNDGFRVVGNDMCSLEIGDLLKVHPTSTSCPVDRETLARFPELEKRVLKHAKEKRRHYREFRKILIEMDGFRQPKPIEDPEVTIVFPHVIMDAPIKLLNCKSKRRAQSDIYEQITSRIRNTSLMYYALPIPSFDTEEKMNKRADFTERFLNNTKQVVYARGDPLQIMRQLETRK